MDHSIVRSIGKSLLASIILLLARLITVAAGDDSEVISVLDKADPQF